MTHDELPVATVILAAGRSLRLGRPKQLLPLGNQPVVAHVLRCVRRSSSDRRYIVLGYAAEEIMHTVDLEGFEVVMNHDFAAGQSSSIRAAVEALRGQVSAAIFILGDQPLQAPEIIDQIIASYQQSPAPIIQPRFAEGPGNPVLIDHSLFDELSQLRGDIGARPILKEQRDVIRYVDASDRHRPMDVDTWEDYERLQQQYADFDVAGDM